MKKNIIIIIIAIIVIGGVVLFSDSNKDKNKENLQSAVVEESKPAVVVYKSPTCGCCGNYVSYLKREGYEVEVENMADLSPVKEKYRIPDELESCHTSVIGDYIVEGHVPIEAIEKMLSEKPDIGGIAMSGMPGGAPGMGGMKNDPFSVHMMGYDGGDLGVFVEI